MFDGRHCTHKDLVLLMDETNKVLECLNKGNKDELESFILFISRFDIDIASNIRKQTQSINDIEKIKRIIVQNINVLKQNVIVDINEHK